MLSENRVRFMLRTELMLLENVPRHTDEIIGKIRLLAKILEISEEDLIKIVDDGFRKFAV